MRTDPVNLLALPDADSPVDQPSPMERHLMDLLAAELLRIPGVGKATARLLWDHFKALDAIIAATPAQLAAIPGIGPRKAEALAGSLKRLKE